MRLSEIGEFGLIERLRKRLAQPDLEAHGIVGIGDDAAVMPCLGEDLLLLTTDTLVEDIHFRRNWMTPYQLGWKAMAANVSDIAAMGGRPAHAVVTLAAPPDLEIEFVDQLFEGLQAVAAEHGARILGGDTVRTHRGLVVGVALTGFVERELLLRRFGARRGQALMVTGALGAAGAGLRLLERGMNHLSRYAEALQAHRQPSPRLKAARALAATRSATACIDLSDGLAGDARRLAEASGVGLRLRLDRVPVAEVCRDACANDLLCDPLEVALTGGEDYELLFTVPKRAAAPVAERLAREANLQATVIGEVVARAQGVVGIQADGTEAPLEGGYQHF
jgi:thiamine-monophosphate kinase